MDKVKLYLELARKHHFWVLCGLSAVVGLVAWYLASGKLATQFNQDKQKIDQAFASLQNLDATQPHGDWTEGINKETEVVGQDVLSAWKTLYQEQKEKVFMWPKELSPDFLEAANQLSDPNFVIKRRLCEYYQSMVKEQVSRLADIVDAASLEELAGNTAAQEHRVDWSQSSQQDIQQSYDWTERPSTLLVKYAQEELWVYQALCNVIKAANEGSTGRHDAVVQEINAMDIAYTAVEDSPGGSGQNRVEPLGSAAASATGPPTAVGGPGGSAGNNRPDPKTRGKREAQSRGYGFGAPSAGGDTAASANPDDLWKNYRYINADETPKMAADVDAGGGEYNLMPFRLLLKMDDRYVDHLLVAFRNSVLPFEVQQVRINPEHTASGGGTFSRSFGPPRGSPPGEPGGMGPPNRFAGPTASAATAQQHDHTVTVELRGVAYLLKPPDLQKLHIAPSAETPASDTAAGKAEAAVVQGVIKQIGDQPAAAAAAGNVDAAVATPSPAAAVGGEATTTPTAPPAAAAPDTSPPAAAGTQLPTP